MPVNYYEKILNEVTKIIIYFNTDGGYVQRFVVKQIKYDLLDIPSGLTMATEDFSENYDTII